MRTIYLDHAATSPIHPEVIEVMHHAMVENYGNPSSIHRIGRKSRQLIDEARAFFAASIHALEKEIFFTSGGTEADNLALIGTAIANQHKGKHIITTNQEHHAILHAAQYLEELGFEVTYLPTDETGIVSAEAVHDVLTDQTILVSIMYVNNETGVMQPIESIGEVLKNHQAYFHTDAVQAYGMLDIDVDKLNLDLLSASAHKINGPKGIGFLYVNEKVNHASRQFGGEQERKKRPGTENLIGILGFHKAAELKIANRDGEVKKYTLLKDLFINTLYEEEITFLVNGELENQVDRVVNLSFPGTNVESLLTNLDLAGIAASSGSACTAGSVEASHVLTAMFGRDNARTMNSIRFSFGLNNDENEIKQAAKNLAKIIKRLTK